jgi:hypothetical protein
LNVISGEQVVIPFVHIFVAGPLCSDRSKLNVNRAATVGCVQRPPVPAFLRSPPTPPAPPSITVTRSRSPPHPPPRRVPAEGCVRWRESGLPLDIASWCCLDIGCCFFGYRLGGFSYIVQWLFRYRRFVLKLFVYRPVFFWLSS